MPRGHWHIQPQPIMAELASRGYELIKIDGLDDVTVGIKIVGANKVSLFAGRGKDER